MASNSKCKASGCERVARVRGRCSAHYQRWYKSARAQGAIKRYNTTPPFRRGCKVEGCDGGTQLIRGLCGRHYGRFIKHGDPLRLLKTRQPVRVSLPDETSPTKLGRLLGVSRQRAHQLLHKEEHLARQTVAAALQSGHLVKPGTCERCQKTTSDLEAHHWDYREALDVRWVCPPCHAIVHPHHPSVHKKQGEAA